MTRIVTYAHRYKRPPRKRAKAAAIEGPVIVRAKKPKTGRSPKASDDIRVNSQRSGETQPAAPPANDDRKSAIVTARKPGNRYVDVPEVTEDEHRRVGDLADAIMQEFKRKIAEKIRK